MRYIVLFPFLILSFFASSQSLETKRAFAQEAVAYLSDSSYHEGIELIRINLLIDLEKKQSASKSEIERRIHHINSTFSEQFERFEYEMGSLRSEYVQYVNDGGTLEFLSFRCDSIPNSRDKYRFEVRFLLEHQGMQNVVKLHFDAAYVMEHFVLLGPFREDF